MLLFLCTEKDPAKRKARAAAIAGNKYFVGATTFLTIYALSAWFVLHTQDLSRVSL